MKRLFIFLGLSMMMYSSCIEKKTLEVAYINEADGSSFTPSEVSALGAEVTISFNTNYQWQIKGYTKLDFCSLSAIKGNAGDASIVVTVERNETGDVRKAEFDILAGAAVKTVTITQTETNAIEIGTTSFDVRPEGGIVEVPVSANIEYSVNIPEEITWVKALPMGKAMANSSIMLEVGANNKWIKRSASGITVTGKDVNGEDITIPLTLNQEAAGATVLFESEVTTAWPAIDRTSARGFHLAMFDGSLLVSDAKKIHKINPADGMYSGEFVIPGSSVVTETMASDDAGNLLFAATSVMPNADFVLYCYDGSSVKQLAKLEKTAISSTARVGNIRVVGDVKKKAVVTCIANNVNLFIAWQIENGVVKETVMKNFPSKDKALGGINFGVASPVSYDLNDGVVFIGYAGQYELWYNADPKNATKDNWTVLFDTGTAGNENYNAVSVAEYKDRKYLAISQDGHFGYSAAPKLILLDITDIRNVTLAYEGKFTGAFARAGVNDVKLVAGSDNLRIYLANAGYNYANCIELK